MNNPPHNDPIRRAFTLLELLLVIAIMGVLVAVVAPRFSAGMSGMQVRTAAQTFMQASRYARTMALLHQMEVDVVVCSGGVIRVEAGPLAGEARGPYQTNVVEGAAATGTGTVARLNAVAASEAGTLDGGPSGGGPSAPAVSASELAADGDAAEDIRAEHVVEGVHIRFLGFNDTETLSAASPDDTVVTEDFRIRYHSNGITRPHRVRLTNDDNMTIDLDIDMLGGATVEGEEAE